MRRILFNRFSGAIVASAISLQATNAQGTFQVVVRPHLVRQAADSISLAYTVLVAPPTADSLVSFIVDAPTLLHADLPGPRASWLVLSKFNLRPVGWWTRLDHLTGVNDSTPPLPMTGRGLLGVVPFWAEKNAPADSVITDSPSDTSSVHDTLIVVHGAQGLTVGIVSFPADLSTTSLAHRLSGLLTQACALGWIDNEGICNSLKVKVKADANSLNALLNELSAQRGKHVSEAAYLLISQNTSYLLTRL